MRFRDRPIWVACIVVALPGLWLDGAALGQSTARPLHAVHGAYPMPRLDEEDVEAVADDSLAAAIAETFISNPELAARRYDLRASDDEIGLALSQTRPQVQAQISGGYDLTLPGLTTQATRPLSDRLNSPNIERNDLTTQFVIDQPLSTGGRARAALRAARAASAAGREILRGVEGDLLVELIAAYSDVRRDTRALVIRRKNVRLLEATLDEIVARREAGELTRTDIAQAEAQLHAGRALLNASEEQLEASRAGFAAIVGRQPRHLATQPSLPLLPTSAEEAFAVAERANPDLAAAFATERAARARIAAARAEGMPQLSLRGTAGTAGPAFPFERDEQDVIFTGRATLSIPLSAGGRVRSLVAQARNRHSAEMLRIEGTRRQMVRAIITAWNQWVTAQRNVETQQVQLAAARIYHEGALEEYREGLRSTFDVLYAQNALREAEIALLASERDRYVSQAVLLRQMGQLETDKLLVQAPGYDPDVYARKVWRRSSLPWDGIVRAIDGVAAPGGSAQPAQWPQAGGDPAMTIPAHETQAPLGLLRSSPADAVKGGGDPRDKDIEP